MANQFQGLFKGMTVNDALALRNQEREQRIRQAMADNAAAGGGFYSNLIAKANAQQAEAFKALGQHFGQQLAPDLIKEDPRLTLARKRDTDKAEIQDMLGKFTSDDGKISEDELKLGFSELMKRGYPDEAQRFLAMAQSMGTMKLKEREVVVGERAVKVKEDMVPIEARKAGATYLNSLKSDKRYEAKTPTYAKSGDKYIMRVPVFDKATGKTIIREVPLGEDAPLGDKFLTPGERARQAGAITGAESQAKADVSQAVKWSDKRQELIDAGAAARSEFGDLTRAIQLAGDIKSGGWRVALTQLQNALGTTSGDIGELGYMLRSTVISRLKEMGAKPTDKDLEYLERTLAGMGQSQETNLRILKKVAERIDKIASRGAWLEANPNVTQEDFNNSRYKAETFKWREDEDPNAIPKWAPSDAYRDEQGRLVVERGGKIFKVEKTK